MKGRKKLAESELKRNLIADADNLEAWEEPFTVPASDSPRPKWYGSKKMSGATARQAPQKSGEWKAFDPNQ